MRLIDYKDRKGGRRSAALCMLAGTAVFLAGCAEYKASPIVAAETAVALETRSLDDQRLARFIEAAKPGARAGDWNLPNLTLAALYFHPDIELSRAKLAVAEASVQTAKQRPNPILSFLPSFNQTVSTPSPWTIGAAVSFLIDATGQRDAKIAQSESMVEAARHDLATASWQVRGQVRSALLALWAAQGRQELVSKRADLQEQFVSVLERRFIVGEATSLDVSRERINLNQLRLTAAEAGRQAEEARAKLASAIGVPLKALANIEPRLAEIAMPAAQLRIASITAPDLRRAALEGRSDVRGLLAEYEAAQAALRLEVAKQFSNLTLGPGYTYDQGDHKYSLEIGGELPIFNRNQGPIAEMTARRQEAAARFTALQAQIIAAIDTALTNHRASMRMAELASNQLASQTDRRRQLQRGVQLGELDRSTVMSADIEIGVAELARYEAGVQQRQALEMLEDALQQPLFELEASAPIRAGLSEAKK